MNISPVNSSTPNFKGKVIAKGKWTEALLDSFTQNSEVKNLVAGNFDLIAKMKTKKPPRNDINHAPDTLMYRVSLIAVPENLSFWGKIKTALGLRPKLFISRNYHSELRTHGIFEERINADKYRTYLQTDSFT